MAFLLASMFYMVVFLTCRITPQKVPPPPEEFSFKNRYNNTYTLPDGHEVTTYQCKGEEARQYFIVRDADSLSITLTPCASSLQWSIHYRPLDINANATVLDQLVTSYSGDIAHNYNTDKPATGVYIITITALERDTGLKILATTTPYGPYSCAPKITDSTIKVSSLKRNSVRLSWQPVSLSASHNHAVKYCVSINTKMQFRSHCSAHAHIYGDTPISLPGILFPWQRKSCFAFPSKRDNSNGAYMECIGNQTSFDVYGLEPSTEYYFNVFAISLFNNRSTSYDGVQFVSKPPKDSKELKIGKTQIVRIKEATTRSTFFSFSLSSKTKLVRISFHPCQAARFTVEIYKKRQLIQQARIKSFKVIKLKRARSGKYTIKIKNNRRGSRTVKIGVFTRKHSYPYPTLPKNKKLRIFLPGCDAFTVAWFVTRERQRYCLYLRKLTNNFYDISSRDRTQCKSPHAKPRGQKIFCKKYRVKNKAGPMTYRVRGLESGATYIVDMYVTSKRDEESLAYQTVTANTKHECSR